MDGGGRFVGETKCENIPRRICIPNNCRMEESKEEECHNKKSLVLHEIPEEVNDLYFSKKYLKCYNIILPLNNYVVEDFTDVSILNYRVVNYSHTDAAKQEQD